MVVVVIASLIERYAGLDFDVNGQDIMTVNKKWIYVKPKIERDGLDQIQYHLFIDKLIYGMDRWIN